MTEIWCSGMFMIPYSSFTRSLFVRRQGNGHDGLDRRVLLSATPWRDRNTVRRLLNFEKQLNFPKPQSVHSEAENSRPDHRRAPGESNMWGPASTRLMLLLLWSRTLRVWRDTATLHLNEAQHNSSES
ncbi:hypothetical protein WMY93_018129 [Mugilogobius chulae]|uniref:Uncharacterized protein n=1 Tax=Mugilogobius chulae TaxID=88201 RepID=A0AAW0NMZ0_9GOBI